MATTAEKIKRFGDLGQGLTALSTAVEGVQKKNQAETARKRQLEGSKFYDAFRLAFFGNKQGALMRLNEDLKDEEKYSDILVDDKTGDVTLKTVSGSSQLVKFDNIYRGLTMSSPKTTDDGLTAYQKQSLQMREEDRKSALEKAAEARANEAKEDEENRIKAKADAERQRLKDIEPIENKILEELKSIAPVWDYVDQLRTRKHKYMTPEERAADDQEYTQWLLDQQQIANQKIKDIQASDTWKPFDLDKKELKKQEAWLKQITPQARKMQTKMVKQSAAPTAMPAAEPIAPGLRGMGAESPATAPAVAPVATGALVPALPMGQGSGAPPVGMATPVSPAAQGMQGGMVPPAAAGLNAVTTPNVGQTAPQPGVAIRGAMSDDPKTQAMQAIKQSWASKEITAEEAARRIRQIQSQ